MKYIFTAFFITLLLISAGDRVHASAVAGALESTQILNNIELIGVNISDAATALNTQLLQIKETVLDPLGNSLIVLSQLQTANGIINLINGGTSGNSLIPGDPRKYVDLKGLEAVKISLGAIASQDSPYTGTLLDSVTQNFKYTSFTTKISQINQSSIPGTVQSQVCDDASLSTLAREDVEVSGQPLDQAAYTARKAYFYEVFCSKSASDPATAQALNQLSAARPGIAMWDKWLATTVGGDNEYNKAVRLNLTVAEELEARRKKAEDDLRNGRGVVSQTECLVRAPTDINGDLYADPSGAPCITDVVLNPSGLLQDSLTKAANAGLDRLANIQGWGSLIQTLTSIAQLSNGIRSVTGAFGGSSGGSSGTGNTSTSGTVTAAPVNDLANDPAKKATIVEPIIKLLDLDTKIMQDLRLVDQTLSADLGTYKARLDDIQDCYEEYDPQNSSAFALFDNRNNIIDGLRQKISNDTTGITSATAQIQSLRNTLETSQSTVQIMDAFNAYQSTASSRPDYTTLAERKGDYTKAKSQATADLSSNGELSRLGTRCENLRQQAQAL